MERDTGAMREHARATQGGQPAMLDNTAAEIQLDLNELAAWERSTESQQAALAQLRDAAVRRQQPHILTDPAGRALAVATTDGTLHLLAPPVLATDDCSQSDERRPEPGFYANRTQTFYVTADHRVFRIRSPGQRVGLARIPTLPDDCEEIDDSDSDHDLYLLAETADALLDPEAVGVELGEPESRTLPQVATAVTYVRVDDVHYQIAVAKDQRVEIDMARSGEHFRSLGRGRWDGERLRELSTSLPPQVLNAIEVELRGAR